MLRTPSWQESAFVPSAAVVGALVLAVIASAAFIFFVHHISASIQASDLAQAIAHETLDVIARMRNERGADSSSDAPPELPCEWQAIPALSWGSIQTVDRNRLLAIAIAHDAVLRMECMPGNFVRLDQPLVSMATREPPGRDLVEAVNAAYGIDA